MANARGFPLCHPKSVDWGTRWRVLVRHREGEEADKGKLTWERSLSWHFKRPGWVRCQGGFESLHFWMTRVDKQMSNSWHAGRYKLGSPHWRSASTPNISTIATPYHLYLAMSRQQVLSFPRVPTYRERMLDVIKRSHRSIQAFDPRTRSLKTFPWCNLIRWRSPEVFTHSCVGPWGTQYASHPTNGATIVRTTSSSIPPVSVHCSSHRVKYPVTLKRRSIYHSMGATEGSG